MQIFVRQLTGGTQGVEVSPSDSVGDIFAALNEARPDGYWACLPATRRLKGRRYLDEWSSLEEQGVKHMCTLEEEGSLLGGGCDGGTTALQRKFMSQATNTKKEEERNKEMEKRAKWSMCAATGEPLGKDMLADDLGYIFNRESILKKLALRKEAPLHKNFTHISKRSHLFELKLEPNPEYDALKGSATRVDTGYAPLFICPITKRPTNGVTPFVALRPCGHVISEQCVKAIKPTEQGHVCIVCATPYNKDTDVVVINPPAESLPEKRKAILEKQAAEKAAAKAEKESKKRSGEAIENAAEIKETKAERAEKKAKLFELAGAGGKVGGVHNKLATTVDLSKNGGTAAHAAKAAKDANYASMFKKSSPSDPKGSYDAFWGQGAMAGVLGSR